MMSIKAIWKKLFGKKEVPKVTKEVPKVIIIRSEPPPLAAGIIPMTDKQMELFECFYGTLIDRPEPNEINWHKKKHAHDGWREGYSNPLELEDMVHDVQATPDVSLQLYEKLMDRLTVTVEEEPLSEIIISEIIPPEEL